VGENEQLYWNMCGGENESLSDSIYLLATIVEIRLSSCLGGCRAHQGGDDDGDIGDATTEEEANDKGDDVGESEGPTSRENYMRKDATSCRWFDFSLVETLQSDQNVGIMKDCPPTMTYYSELV
jgi:hypothetical protein